MMGEASTFHVSCGRGRAMFPAFVVAVCLALAVSLALPGQPRAEPLLVKIRSEQSPRDLSHDYFVKLLELALGKTQEEYGVARVMVTSFNPTQKRALHELSLGGVLTVDWAGTSREREKMLRPIRVPLIGGLLGYRVPVIHRDSVASFSSVRTLDDLKLHTAVQGTHWPDTDILEGAGLKVQRVSSFGLMYDLLLRGRADYFPRGLNEVYAELKAVPDGTLVAFDSLLIAYPLPMYFFTGRHNEELAQRIEKGLRMAIADGSFMRFMEHHPATAPMFPLSKYARSRVIRLANPDLPEETPLGDESLWVRIGGAPGR